jgi:hypothetical protein
MKTSHFVLFLLPILLVAGCGGGESASKSAATPAASANSNQAVPSTDSNTNSSNPSGASASANSNGPSQLVGSYESREVHDQGVVTLITQLKTSWIFSADGTYQRLSQVKGATYHADSGTFRIEPPDNLVLAIQVTGQKAKRKIQNPPISKTHKFSLSPDGDELRLTSAKGSVAIFERIAKPKTP